MYTVSSSIVQFKSRAIRYKKQKFENVLRKVCSCRSDNHVEFVTVLRFHVCFAGWFGIYAVMMYWMDGKILHATKRPGWKGTGRGDGDPTLSWLEITTRILLHCRGKA